MPAMFELNLPAGLRIRPDPNDNPQGHPNPNHESGLVAVFEVANVGDETDQCRASIYVGDTFIVEWASDPVPPGGGVNAVQPLGRHDAGEYVFTIYINPGSGQNDNTSNGITVD